MQSTENYCVYLPNMSQVLFTFLSDRISLKTQPDKSLKESVMNAKKS